jgi:uncharacterized protein YecT (DUF1311 family)
MPILLPTSHFRNKKHIFYLFVLEHSPQSSLSVMPFLVKSFLLILLLLIVPAVPTNAQKIEQITQNLNCENLQSTAEMNDCAGREYRTADQKLNQVYRQLQSKLRGKQKQRMTNAQLAWIKFRDANCNYERGTFEGGTGESFIGTSCLTRMTQQRTKELEAYLQDTFR